MVQLFLILDSLLYDPFLVFVFFLVVLDTKMQKEKSEDMLYGSETS